MATARKKKVRKKLNLYEREKIVARVPAVVPTGGEVGPGRPEGSINKTMPDYKRMKQGLVEIFNNSKGPSIINEMLNMKLPPMLRPQNRDKITAGEDANFRRLLLQNFKWATEIVVKTVPKELGVFGKIEHEHTLAAMSRRATRAPKSSKVIDMVAKRRATDITEYEAEYSSVMDSSSEAVVMEDEGEQGG